MTSSKEQLEALKNQIAELESKLESEKSEKADKISVDDSRPIKNIYSWKAPDRIYPKRTKNWYIVVSVFAIITIFLSLIFQNFTLILAVLAIIFLVYALYTVPPNIIENTITNKGVKSGDQFFLWKDTDYFWLAERNDEFIVNIELKNYEGRINLLVGEGNINRIITELIKSEDYREPKGFSGFIDRITSGKHKKISEFIEISGLHHSEKKSDET